MPVETELNPGCEVLLLEDDSMLRRRLAGHLRQLGAEVTETTTIEQARQALANLRFDYALVDLHLPDGEALDLLREGRISENTGVVVMTAFGGIRKAVEAMRLGAGDYLTKPFEPEELPLAFLRCREKRVGARRDEVRASDAASDELFFGDSLAPVREQLERILATDRRLVSRLPPVLIEGETGTGKSLLARWLHRQGPRAHRPFININCAALPESLAESELFGHERGAFTDARAARIGLFEAADGGTLFLDEIGALAPAVQSKVLTAVEDHAIRRIGASKEILVDARLIAATNRPLEDLVEEGSFREDLFHRLRLLPLALPPLRERQPDLAALAQHLLERIARRHRLKCPAISPAGADRLRTHSWPGNARELAHEIERELILGRGGPLEFAHLGPPDPAAPPGWRNPQWRLPPEGFQIEEVIDALVDEALRETNHNVSAAARRLGVTREFLRYRLRHDRQAE
ncbi:MAG TPA: sigma-54 dependent transcriptional regulator [Candidatus Didemnitutus sp.]|nr:sigma-54 dependent transcriptional regulator [Candidatus Didemnitutus sp.]